MKAYPRIKHPSDLPQVRCLTYRRERETTSWKYIDEQGEQQELAIQGVLSSIKEMVEYAKKNPGKINRGSPGAAILTNLAPMAFEKKQGFSTTHIPFNGDSPALQALLGGQIDIHGTSITGSLPYIRAGKLRVLGVMDGKRLPQVPDAPTFKEQGYDIEATLWYSLSVPAGTPRDVIDPLNKVVNQVIADPEFVAKARAIGMEPRGGTPEELSKFIKLEADRWVPVLQSLNLPKQAH